MIGYKVILFLLPFVLMVCGAGKRKVLRKCPDCEPKREETVEAYAMQYINGTGPSHGRCVDEGAIQWIFKGKFYGATRDACCCLIPPPAPAVTCPPRSPVTYCPTIINPIRSETLGNYYGRIGSEQTNAPTNGCCHVGSYKVVFDKSLTGTTNDVCVCINQKTFKVINA